MKHILKRKKQEAQTNIENMEIWTVQSDIGKIGNIGKHRTYNISRNMKNEIYKYRKTQTSIGRYRKMQELWKALNKYRKLQGHIGKYRIINYRQTQKHIEHDIEHYRTLQSNIENTFR